MHPIKRNIPYERLMATIAAINLGLVAFDMAYVPWRNFWLQRSIQIGDVRIPLPLPNITPLYDPIKGIQPNRDTTAFSKPLNNSNGKFSRMALIPRRLKLGCKNCANVPPT
jgi:hypothetical protein